MTYATKDLRKEKLMAAPSSCSTITCSPTTDVPRIFRHRHPPTSSHHAAAFAFLFAAGFIFQAHSLPKRIRQVFD